MAEDARIRLGGGPIERKSPESDSVDDRIKQSQEYVKFHKDLKSGAMRKEIEKKKQEQAPWRDQVEKLVKVEIDAYARKH